MNSLHIPLLSLLAIAFVVYRQLRTRPAAGTTTHLVAAAMVVLGLVSGIASGGLFDTGQLALSVALFVVEAAAAVALGAWRARTVRVWLDDSGTAWSKATGWTMLVWLASVATRIGSYLAGDAFGLTVSPWSLLLFLGLTIGAQSYLVHRRGRALASHQGRPATFFG